MNRPRCCYALTLLVLVGAATSQTNGQATEPPRQIREVTDGWRFQVDARNLGDTEHWFDPKHDRSAWRAVTVPQAWDLYDQAMWGYEGIAWYSTALDRTFARPGMAQWLSFARVMYHAKVWLNGQCLGEHLGGYLPFRFDVTGKLKDADNLLVIRVDNQPRMEWPPAAQQIEWVQYGGILQPVRIESTPTLAVSRVAIRAEPKDAGASIDAAITIDARVPLSNTALRVEIFDNDPSHPPLLLGTQQRAIAPAPAINERVSLILDKARPWSPDSPRLHTMVVTLLQGETVIDQSSTTFGIRSIQAKGRRILLNGQPLQIKGVNRYDEYARFGPNPPWPLVEDDVRVLKQTGVNLIRSHYPQAPEFLSLCDRKGILYLEELPLNWWGVDWFGSEGLVHSESILDKATPMLEEMIERDHNHPCIIIWSMANESKTDNSVGVKVMRALIRRTKQLDPTRLVTFVTAPGSVKEHEAYADADIVATNMYFGSLKQPYAMHLDQLDEKALKPSRAHLQKQIEAFPNKPLIIAEYGAIGITGIRGNIPSSEDFQAAYIQSVWRAITDVPEVSGGVLWSWADYYHRRHFQSFGPFGAYGAVTVDRKPKQALKALATMYGGEQSK